jgi:uncharacterized repeat protein (TIGR03803 family)
VYANSSRLTENRASMLAKAFSQKGPAVALALAIILSLAAAASAQTFKVLYRFNGASDGANPWGGLVRDRAGNLYGTTSCGPCMSAYGTIFKVDAKGHESTLYNFTGGADGAEPDSTLIQDSAGYLYGTTAGGGAYGLGTVFKVDTAGNLTVLFSFSGYSTGFFPFGGLILDADGNLYGTTEAGGSFYGTVFKLDASGNETLLHTFTGTDDGGLPQSGLVADDAGNLYGATSIGGPSGGALFEITSSGTFTKLYGFRNDTVPVSSLILRDHKLYGTAMYGSTGNGMVFTFNTLIGKGKDLYDFKGTPDGSQPVAGLVADSAGNLYGTTMAGGQSGNGTIFKLDKAGNETVLYSFSGGTDGSAPSGLIMDAAGSLYGTTYSGGHAACYCGVVFKLTP